jgi:hypothetical protein
LKLSFNGDHGRLLVVVEVKGMIDIDVGSLMVFFARYMGRFDYEGSDFAQLLYCKSVTAYPTYKHKYFKYASSYEK